MKSNNDSDPVEWLRMQFQKCLNKNPSYTQQAFAKKIGLHPGRLSEVFARKRRITPKMALKICQTLAPSNAERQVFIGALEHERFKDIQADDPQQQSLSETELSVISEWYHFAILSLMRTKGFRSSPRWIAGRLGISVQEVRSSLERLEKLKLIQKEKGKYRRTESQLTSSHNVPSKALRKLHVQSLKQVVDRLEEVPVNERDVTHLTMAIDPNRIEGAKEIIKKFRRELTDYLEVDEQTEVYHLNVQLMPVSR